MNHLKIQDAKPVSRMRKINYLAMALIFFAPYVWSEIVYQWRDNDGILHFSDQPPNEANLRDFDIQFTPSKEESKIKTDRKPKAHIEKSSSKAKKRKVRNFLDIAVPEFVKTKTFEIKIIDWKHGIAEFLLQLTATTLLPDDAYLEVYFDNPDDPKNPLIIGKNRKPGEQELLILSPGFKGLRCMDYQAKVYIYQADKETLLGIYDQNIRSKINLSRIKTYQDVLRANKSGNCL